MKRSVLAIAVAFAAALPGLAAADVSANIALTSKYKFRGQDQSDTEKSFLPAVQGGFDFSAGGFYLGNWNSSIGFGGGTEVDLYGGYRGEFGGGFTYDVGLLYYFYPGDTSLSTLELYGSVGYGPVSFKYSRTMNSSWFGVEDGRGSGYFEVNGGFDVGAGFTLIGHVGTSRLTSEVNDAAGPDYFDWKVGASYDLGSGFKVEGDVVGATKKDQWGDANKTRFLVTLSKSL